MRRPAAVLPLLALVVFAGPAVAQEDDASPGREPVPAGPAGVVRVPHDEQTIQEAVDVARPGASVLIAPGVYREAVVVTTPYLTIRGLDRDDTILDGDFRLADAIHVVEADGVTIENLTARHYLRDGFRWSRVFGFRGAYLTAHANGENGVLADGSRYGRIERSYAGGAGAAGIAIEACNPCDVVVTDVLAEHNAFGFRGTNAGGNLAVVNSEWRANAAGLVAITADSEPFAPQGGMVIAGNHVHGNGSTAVIAEDVGYLPLGSGILIAGGRDDRIVGNLVEDQPAYGIGVAPFLDRHLWPSSGNRVEGNVIRGSGRADLALAAPAAGGDCFAGNTTGSSQPPAVEFLFPCEGFTPFPLGGGSMAPTVELGLAGSVDLLHGGLEPRDRRDPPPPLRDLPDMPGEPTATPPHPAIPDEIVPGTYRIRGVGSIRSTGGIGQEASPMLVPVLATSWWSLLLGLYGYILPFVLYAAWVAVAMWDLIRRDADPMSIRIGWIAIVLLVPFAGPVLYFAFGRSPIPGPMRLALTAGGTLAYLLFVVVGLALGG